MNGHPGGAAHTEELLAAAELPYGARVLDMGAGDGSALRLLREKGFRAEGIDLKPRSEDVAQGDFLHTDFGSGSFDGVLSQCAFYVSGDAAQAFRESARVLKTGGRLFFSDVWFDSEESLWESLREAGFRVLFLKDLTESWREYYIEGIWKGTIDPGCLPKGRCRYYAAAAEKI